MRVLSDLIILKEWAQLVETAMVTDGRVSNVKLDGSCVNGDDGVGSFCP
jgi:hypothetical protein